MTVATFIILLTLIYDCSWNIRPGVVGELARVDS